MGAWGSLAWRQALLALLCTLLLTAVALAGADHPPPAGFVLLAMAIAGWSAAVCWVRWCLRRRRPLLQAGLTAGAATLIGVAAWGAFLIRAAAVEGVPAGNQWWIGMGVAGLGSGVLGLLIAVLSLRLVDRGGLPSNTDAISSRGPAP